MNTHLSKLWGKQLDTALGRVRVEKKDDEQVSLTSDKLQNELILIIHHLDDAEEGIKENDLDYIKASLHDIREVVDRLSRVLSPEHAQNIAAVRAFDEEEPDADRTK
jgi:hypothetical protein